MNFVVTFLHYCELILGRDTRSGLAFRLNASESCVGNGTQYHQCHILAYVSQASLHQSNRFARWMAQENNLNNTTDVNDIGHLIVGQWEKMLGVTDTIKFGTYAPPWLGQDCQNSFFYRN